MIHDKTRELLLLRCTTILGWYWLIVFSCIDMSWCIFNSLRQIDRICLGMSHKIRNRIRLISFLTIGLFKHSYFNRWRSVLLKLRVLLLHMCHLLLLRVLRHSNHWASMKAMKTCHHGTSIWVMEVNSSSHRWYSHTNVNVILMGPTNILWGWHHPLIVELPISSVIIR